MTPQIRTWVTFEATSSFLWEVPEALPAVPAAYLALPSAVPPFNREVFTKGPGLRGVVGEAPATAKKRNGTSRVGTQSIWPGQAGDTCPTEDPIADEGTGAQMCSLHWTWLSRWGIQEGTVSGAMPGHLPGPVMAE